MNNLAPPSGAQRRDLFRAEYPWLYCTWEADPRGSGYACGRCHGHVRFAHGQEFNFVVAADLEAKFVHAHAQCALQIPSLTELPQMPIMTFDAALAAATPYLRKADLAAGEPVEIRMVEAHLSGCRILCRQEGEHDPEFQRFIDPQQTEPEPDGSTPPLSLLEGAYWTPL